MTRINIIFFLDIFIVAFYELFNLVVCLSLYTAFELGSTRI